MSNRFRISSQVIGRSVFAISIVSTGIADETTKSRFMSEYPSEAKILKDRWERCSASFRTVSHDGKPVPNGYDAKFWRSNGYEKFENVSTIPSKSGPIELRLVECAGDDGSYFTLTSDSENPVFKARKVSTDERSINLYEQNAGRVMRSNLGGHRKPLITMIEEKSAELVDAAQVPGEPKHIEATFRVQNGTRISQLVVRFDTTNHWSVVRQALFIDSPPKNTTTYQVEYGDRQDGLSLPRKVTMSEKKYDYVISDWKFAVTPKEAFTTAHYGLSDLVEAKKSQDATDQKKQAVSKFTRYLLGGAAVATLTAIALFYFSIRKSRTSSEHVS